MYDVYDVYVCAGENFMLLSSGSYIRLGREILSAAKAEGGYADSDDEEEFDDHAQNSGFSRRNVPAKSKLSRAHDVSSDNKVPSSNRNPQNQTRLTKLAIFASKHRLSIIFFFFHMPYNSDYSILFL